MNSPYSWSRMIAACIAVLLAACAADHDDSSSIVTAAAISPPPMQGDAAMPRIVTQDGRHALLVDDAPYLILGAQVHNSSNYP